MGERIYSLLPWFLWVINSILLAKYFNSYLMPKNEKISCKLTLISFGGIYFISQFLINKLLFGLQGPIRSFVSLIILMLLVFSLSLVFFKKNLRLIIFLLFSFFAAQEICEYIFMSIQQTLGNTHVHFINYLMKHGYFTTSEKFLATINGYATFQFCVSMMIYGAIAAFTLRSITKRFVYKNYALTSTELSYLLLPCLPGLVMTHIIYALLIRQNDPYLIYEAYNEVPFIDFLVPLSGIIFLLGLIAAVMFFQKLAVLHNEEIERSVLQRQVQQLQQQVTNVDGIYTEIRGFRHDIKNHISNILILANAIIEDNSHSQTNNACSNQDRGNLNFQHNTNKKEELEEYLKKIGETLDKFEFSNKTGNSILDIIIHQKHHDSLQQQIDFTADFIYPAHLNLDVYDLAIILINALENAIEACSKVEDSNRFIHLYAYTKGEMFFIEVENSFENAITLDKNTGLPRSSKPDKTIHGMGLSNIKRCAGKYFGDIDFQISEEKNYYVFRLTVMLQGRD